jgi:hypothetical protein
MYVIVSSYEFIRAYIVIIEYKEYTNGSFDNSTIIGGEC